VYLNVNLTDSKLPDIQAGMEKMGSFVLGMLAGADLFGHAGIVGTDHGASLEWLVFDDEAMGYAQRIANGFGVNEETLAMSVMSRVGPGGNYLSDDHTVDHFRQEFFLPGARWTRETYEVWKTGGEASMSQRAHAHVEAILATHRVPELDPALDREIGRIVDAARKELVG
jgi:trimethylamine--corrinoid protein Co-methyltransferase